MIPGKLNNRLESSLFFLFGLFIWFSTVFSNWLLAWITILIDLTPLTFYTILKDDLVFASLNLISDNIFAGTLQRVLPTCSACHECFIDLPMMILKLSYFL